MKPTPQAIENAARAHAEMRKRITGSAIERLPSDRLFAEAILRSDLGDMVLVPKEATEAMRIAVAKLDWESKQDLSWADGYRAMIAAVEDEQCK